MESRFDRRELLFQPRGIPPLGTSLSLALQHLVAMIVGCVTPPIIIAGAIGLSQEEQVLLIQASLVMSAVCTFLQLYPIGGRFGSGLPVILGVSFAYVPSMQAIAASGGGVAAIAGAMIVGGIVAVLVGVFVKKIRRLFPPVITGTVVFTIGLSLYPTAINYMAGGTGNTYESVVAQQGLTEALVYGSWQNWLIAALTLTAVLVLNHKAKGICKLASILIGMLFGYAVALCFGMVSFADVGNAAWFALPEPLHFGLKFDPASCVAIGLLFAINSIQAIGDFTATTVGGLDRDPTDQELQGGIIAYGTSNILTALMGGLPTATYSQNVGIVTTNKVVNRTVFAIAGGFLLLAGISPKFAALLTTIPQCVRGGRHSDGVFHHCHDGHEAHRLPGPDGPEHHHCGSLCCSGRGDFPGLRGPQPVPGGVHHGVRTVSRGDRNYHGGAAEPDFAQGEMKKRTPDGFPSGVFI